MKIEISHAVTLSRMPLVPQAQQNLFRNAEIEIKSILLKSVIMAPTSTGLPAWLLTLQSKSCTAVTYFSNSCWENSFFNG